MASILWTIPLLLVTGQPPNPTPSDQWPAAALRPADPVLSALVTRGLSESPTFLDLVTAIAGLKGVVYINWSVNLPNRLGAAFLPSVILAPDGTRRVWIVVRRGSRPDLVAVLGHELQHALELLGSGAVTAKEIDSLFRRLDGRGLGPPYETGRAQEVQRMIAAEVRASAAKRLPPRK
jgi:hypothetical protein